MARRLDRRPTATSRPRSVRVTSTHFSGPDPVESTCESHTDLKKTTVRQSKNVVGPAVRRLRRSQRTLVSQQDLAGRLAARGIAVDRSAIARIEAGERYVLDYEVAAIAQTFRVPIEQLFCR